MQGTPENPTERMAAEFRKLLKNMHEADAASMAKLDADLAADDPEEDPVERLFGDLLPPAEMEPRPVPMRLLHDGKLNVGVMVAPDKTVTLEINGEKLDNLGELGENLQRMALERLDKFVLWGRHMMWRAVVGMVGFTFVLSLNAGPWVTTGYTVALVFAGDLAMRYDKRRTHVCLGPTTLEGKSAGCGYRTSSYRRMAAHAKRHGFNANGVGLGGMTLGDTYP